MAKRFTESKIWADTWFQDLPIVWKCFWKYLCDSCDEAGIWKINFKLAEFQIGTKIKFSEAEKYFNNHKKRVEFFDEFWVIKDFIVFQYGEKVFTSEHGFHKKIRSMLDRVSHRVLHKPKGVQVKEEEEVKEEVIVFKDVRGVIGEIIGDLNQVLNTSYKPTSLKTIELIQSRMKEGATVDDFKVVHRKMAKAWGLDNKMRQFLRPITLYGTKFEGYLNRPDDIRELTQAQQSNLKQLQDLRKEVANDKSSV